jgi:hypothetical protein
VAATDLLVVEVVGDLRLERLPAECHLAHLRVAVAVGALRPAHLPVECLPVECLPAVAAAGARHPERLPAGCLPDHLPAVAAGALLLDHLPAVVCPLDHLPAVAVGALLLDHLPAACPRVLPLAAVGALLPETPVRLVGRRLRVVLLRDTDRLRAEVRSAVDSLLRQADRYRVQPGRPARPGASPSRWSRSASRR